MAGRDIDTIPTVLAAAEQSFGAEEAVVDGDVTLSFSELRSEALRYARALIAAGVEPGDRVGLWAPNSVEWVVASFGVYCAGAVLVPLNTRFKSDEAAHVLGVSGAKLLLTVTDFLGTDFVGMVADRDDLPQLDRIVILRGGTEDPSTTSLKEFLDAGDAVAASSTEARSAALDGDSRSDIIFTSGTTGRPKGAVLTHGSSVVTYQAWSDCVGLRAGDRYLIVYPFFHTAGLKSGVLACLLKGSTIVPYPVFDVEGVMDTVAKQRISMLPGPPTVFQSILDHPKFDTFDLSSLRLSVTGAATVPVEIIRRMREDMRLENVVTGYGLTETTGTVSMCRHDDPPEIIATTVGRPIPGVEVKVVDDAGEALGAGDAGEILVRGYNVMKEYFDDPAETAAAIDADGWLRTGDVGFVGEDGNIRITDRIKDMLISGGFNVYPAELERIIVTHPAVSQVAIIGLPDERMGEVGQAVVVLRPGTSLTEDELVSWCRNRMANYKVPRYLRVVDVLPLNPSGKVMKYVLRNEAAGAGHPAAF